MPFPIGRGPLACVARDQIRDQIADQRGLRRPAPSQTERRIEIRGTYCNGSGHMGRGCRVENPAVPPGPPAMSMIASGPSLARIAPSVMVAEGAAGRDGLAPSSPCLLPKAPLSPLIEADLTGHCVNLRGRSPSLLTMGAHLRLGEGLPVGAVIAGEIDARESFVLCRCRTPSLG